MDGINSLGVNVTDLQQVPVESVEEVFRKGFEDFQYFADIAIPEVMMFHFPPYYIAIWKMLVAARTAEERAKIIRFALGLPRGFVKTTFIKVLICWLVCYDMTEFVLNVCADEPLAYNVLADIDAILSSQNIEKIYGKWAVNKAIDNKEMKTGRYRGRNLIMVAVGINSNIRGINIGHRRPDIIFFDDAQSSDNAKSDIESEKLIEKFVGTFLKLVNPHHAMVIYVGNMYIGNCLLAQLRDNEGWISLITGCILETGESLWPELHKVKDLFEEYKHDAAMGLGHVWFAEKQNDPVSFRTSLLPGGQLPAAEFKMEDVEKSEGGFVIIDPAGMKDSSDDNVIMANLIFNDKPMVVEGKGGIMNPEEVVRQAIKFCVDYNLGVVGVEAAAYQGTLVYWAMKLSKELGFEYIQWVELTSGGKSKQLRIIAWIRELLDDSAHITGEVRLKVLWQALAYKMNKLKNKDDWLDAGAYTTEFKNTPEYWDLAKSVVIRGNKALPAARVVGNNTPF